METTKELSEDDKMQIEEMKIKIQTFDNNFPIVIKRNASVAELKEKIREVKLSNIHLVNQYSKRKTKTYFPRKITATER